MGSCSVVQCVSHLMGQPLYCSAVDAGLWGKREAVVMAPPLHVTQQYHLASMAARLFSTGISYHSLLPLIPLISLSTVNSSPCPGIAPRALNSSSQLLPFQETRVPARHMYGFGQRLSDPHSI